VESIHQFVCEGIDGEKINFADFKGRKVLVVNVASECGFTPQYQQLQELYLEFQDKLMIVGFPSNQFGGQEPGTDEEIKAFCEKRYGVSFSLSAKTKVTGPEAHEVYQWLSEQARINNLDPQVHWNFQKYLLDENGRLVAVFPSSITPLDDQILSYF
jgi:glutathione peroxidase